MSTGGFSDMSYHKFISSINKYSSSIAQGSIQQIEDNNYTGVDLKNIVESNPDVNPRIVYALEETQGFLRMRDLKNKTPKNYYEDYQKVEEAKASIRNKVTENINLMKV